MTDAFIIETQGRVAGIAVHDGREFRFFASDNLFWTLENRAFRNLRQVYRTIDAFIAGRAQRRRSGQTVNTLQQRLRDQAADLSSPLRQRHE